MDLLATNLATVNAVLKPTHSPTVAAITGYSVSEGLSKLGTTPAGGAPRGVKVLAMPLVKSGEGAAEVSRILKRVWREERRPQLVLGSSHRFGHGGCQEARASVQAHHTGVGGLVRLPRLWPLHGAVFPMSRVTSHDRIHTWSMIGLFSLIVLYYWKEKGSVLKYETLLQPAVAASDRSALHSLPPTK